jgi:hypothetical protein
MADMRHRDRKNCLQQLLATRLKKISDACVERSVLPGKIISLPRRSPY